MHGGKVASSVLLTVRVTLEVVDVVDLVTDKVVGLAVLTARDNFEGADVVVLVVTDTGELVVELK